MDTTHCTTGSLPTLARAATPQPVQPQETKPAHHPPSLVERMPQASLLSIVPVPVSGDDARAAGGTPPQQASTGLLNLPTDLLLRLIPFLRTENTIPAIRNVARFRATCKPFYQSIPQPIPEGVMGAVEFNRLDVLNLLLDLQQSGRDVAQHLNSAGRPLSFPKSDSATLLPLAVAAYLGHVDLVKALVTAGANLDHKDKNGFTALLIAAGHGHTATVQALLQAGANLDQQADPEGPTALMYAAMRGDSATIQVLLAWGAVADQPLAVQRCDCEGWTALIYAAEEGHTGAVQVLLQAGAKVDLADRFGLTALRHAAEKGHAGTMQALLQAGAKVDQFDIFGSTALMSAASEGNASTVHTLLHAGADFTLTTKRGETALDFATNNQHEEVIKLLRAHGAAAYT